MQQGQLLTNAEWGRAEQRVGPTQSANLYLDIRLVERLRQVAGRESLDAAPHRATRPAYLVNPDLAVIT